jgi:chaperone required for assembly of F1-ATPase
MTEWAAKRFWASVDVVEAENGFNVTLDGRRVLTPQKSVLSLPTHPFAQRLAAEWSAVEGAVDPNAMPITRAANSAIDKVTPQRTEIIDILAAYGESDLLCYHADQPRALVERQQAQWSPWLDWACQRYNAPMVVTSGISPVSQDPQSMLRLREPLKKMTVFQLTGMHDLITISGSLVLALAITDGEISAEDAWPISRLDELWQIEEWGADEEAEELGESKRKDFLRAFEIFSIST